MAKTCKTDVGCKVRAGWLALRRTVGSSILVTESTPTNYAGG